MVDLYGSDRGDYEVIHNGDFKNFKYTIRIEEDIISKYTCLKSNLTGISCSLILAIIWVKKFELNQFICPFYRAQALLNTWYERFYPYPNQIDSPKSNGLKIIPEQ
jgi:hypothetical protein